MVSFIYVTCSSPDEAQALARQLVEEKKIACANIFPAMTSLYPWKGEIQTDSESAMILKTRQEKVPEVLERIKELHSYENPCALEISIGEGLQAYKDWLLSETES